MILGMSVHAFTVLHVVISLLGILSGLVVLAGLFASKRLAGWTLFFLSTTVLTSVTGFFFPRDRILPSHIVGVISLVVLAVAIAAYYAARLSGAWRGIYVASALLALYLNVFVAVVQSFLKFPSLNALAPTQSEPPFLVAQLVVLAAFIGLCVAAIRMFRPVPDSGARASAAGEDSWHSPDSRRA